MRMLKYAGVYKIECTLTRDYYIGSSGVSIARRWKAHKSELRRNKHNNGYLQNAWNKYGEKNFRFIILAITKPSEALILEDKILKAWECPYNLTKDAFAPMTGKTDEKAPFYGKHHTKESKAKMSKNHADISGENNPRWGVRLSEETKEKISKAKTGKHLTEEHKRKVSQNHANVSGKNNPMYGKTGENHPRYGKHHTMETKRKMSEIRKRYWADKKAGNI